MLIDGFIGDQYESTAHGVNVYIYIVQQKEIDVVVTLAFEQKFQIIEPSAAVRTFTENFLCENDV